jgi:hypothetical protein
LLDATVDEREQVPDQESGARGIDFDLAHPARADRRIMMRERERLDESDRSGGQRAELEMTVVAQQAALEAQRERRVTAEAERDRRREPMRRSRSGSSLRTGVW